MLIEEPELITKSKKQPANIEITTVVSMNDWCPDSESNQGHGDFQSPACKLYDRCNDLFGSCVKFF